MYQIMLNNRAARFVRTRLTRIRRETVKLFHYPLSLEYSGKNLSLIILDDTFPWMESTFRYYEYSRLLEEVSDAVVLASPDETDAWYARMRKFRHDRPDLYKRVFLYRDDTRLKARGAYCSFLFNVIRYIDWLESKQLKFVFQLYPGGCFGISDEKSDKCLSRVFSSRMFVGVITTQTITTEYVKKRFGISDDAICEVYGVPHKQILSEETIQMIRKIKDESDCQHLTITFAAHKYMPGGLDKGFDTFCRIAHKFRKRSDMRFVCIGSYSANDAPVDIRDDIQNIIFKGNLPVIELERVLAETDIFVNPSRPNILMTGGFDGFPTTTTVMASLAGACVITTDILGLNRGRFKTSCELFIVRDSISEFCEVIDHLSADKQKLKRVAESGRIAMKRAFDFENQMHKRIKFISERVELN